MKYLKTLWKQWLGISKPIGNFQAQVLLTGFYLIIIFPIGLIFRVLADPLKMRLKKTARTNFEQWEHLPEDINQAKKQY